MNVVYPGHLEKYKSPYESTRALTRNSCYTKRLKGELVANKYLVTFSKGKQFKAHSGL